MLGRFRGCLRGVVRKMLGRSGRILWINGSDFMILLILYHLSIII